jgi:hypothetical protein
VYLPCDIDKARARGETWPVDPELREALNQAVVDLRGEIRTSVAEARVYVDERLQTSAAETRAYVDERFQTSESGMRVYIDERLEVNTGSLLHEMRESESRTRRYFDVVGESLRGEFRGLAELIGLSNEESKRRDDEQAGRTDGIENRVLQLEVRVKSLEDDRNPRRPRRRR